MQAMPTTLSGPHAHNRWNRSAWSSCELATKMRVVQDFLLRPVLIQFKKSHVEQHVSILFRYCYHSKHRT